MRQSYILSFVCILLSVFSLQAQDDCTDRFQKIVFPRVDFDGNVDYDSWAKYNGGRKLRYDVYTPQNDTATLRPLIVLWHGGAFVDFIKKNSPDILRLAKDLAKAGYVVITPDYRGMIDLTGFGNKEEIIKVVVGSTLDAHDAFCHIFSQIDDTNPYRIDKNQIFMGGVSAGAIIGLHGILLETTDQLGEEIASYARKIDQGRIDEVLDNKFCGSFHYLKSFFSVSGAMIDTSFIQHTPLKFFHIHGTEDDFVAYNIGQPLWGLTAAPPLYGAKPIHEKLIHEGIDSKIMVFEGGGHVPYLNIDIESFSESLNLINEKKYQQCLDSILSFLFEQVQCEKQPKLTTSVKNNISHDLNIYPNPTSRILKIKAPNYIQGQIEIFDIKGKKINESVWSGIENEIDIENLNEGMYILKIHSKDVSKDSYIGKFIKQNISE